MSFKLGLLLSSLALAGCMSGASTNMRVGTEQNYVSLKDQREALAAVKVYQDAPAGSLALGKVDASRCHRRQGMAEPTEADVLIDLQVAAYAKGADGIVAPKFAQESALTINCWYLLTGSASMVTVKK